MAALISPLTESAVNAFYESISRLVACSPGMYERRTESGTGLVFTGLAIPTLNLVRVGSRVDLEEVDAFAAEMSTKDVPWTVELRGEPDADLLAVAARHGRTSAFGLPLRVWDADLVHSLPASEVAGATVREISGSESEVFAGALASGYEVPRAVADALARPALLDAPDMTAFVLELGGEAVACGSNVMVGEYVGMYNGAVPPLHRGNGYYRALVTARLRHAVARGARYAFSQNTPMSRPLYEALGFRVVESVTYIGAP